MPFKITVKDHN